MTDYYQPSTYWWAYSPKTNQVEVHHAFEDHPLDIKTHGQIASESDHNLIHGYAHRHRHRWSLYDYDHKELGDPFLEHKVLSQINKVDSES